MHKNPEHHSIAFKYAGISLIYISYEIIDYILSK